MLTEGPGCGFCLTLAYIGSSHFFSELLGYKMGTHTSEASFKDHSANEERMALDIAGLTAWERGL